MEGSCRQSEIVAPMVNKAPISQLDGWTISPVDEVTPDSLLRCIKCPGFPSLPLLKGTSISCEAQSNSKS